MHNIVNERLGNLFLLSKLFLEKEIFPCEHSEKAWGGMGCGCSPEELIQNLKKQESEEAPDLVIDSDKKIGLVDIPTNTVGGNN